MKLLIELDKEHVKAIDKIKFLVGGRTDRKLQLEIIKAIKNGKALEQEPQTFKWCTDCKEYDQEKHCCHRYSKVIRDTVEEMKQELKSEWEYDHAILKAYSDGANEVLDAIRVEIEEVYNDRPHSYNHSQRTKLFCEVMKIIDKYKGESEG